MTTASRPASALAAMIAPRKLQSPGAPVQAVGEAVSSGRSTVNVTANERDGEEAPARRASVTRKPSAGRRPRATSRTVNSNRTPLIFIILIVMLCPDALAVFLAYPSIGAG